MKQDTPMNRFSQHKCRTKGRLDAAGNPIEFKLTFEQWWDIWQKSGKWNQRGNKRGQYVMSRKNDLGHYEIGNVEIIESIENVRRGKNYAVVSRVKSMTVTCPKCGKVGGDAGMRNWHFDNCGRTLQQVQCPHCGKVGKKGAGMKRWHFDNCVHAHHST